MQQIWKSIVNGMSKFEYFASAILLIIIVATISGQIIARYIFSSPAAWMEEAVMIMFIYLTLLSAAYAAKEKRHIVVDLFPFGRVSKVLGVIMSIGIVVILAVIIYNIPPVYIVEMRRKTVSLPYNFPLAYYNSIPLIYCFFSIIISTLYDLIFEHKETQEALI